LGKNIIFLVFVFQCWWMVFYCK